MKWFVTGSSTGVGKTHVSCALAGALHARDIATAAMKPVETGCEPDPADAQALARACGRPALADAPGFHRARAPLAPAAATMLGEPACPSPDVLAEAVRAAGAGADAWIVEGAGGLFVPLDPTHDLADLALALDLPVVLVAVDELGVLGHVLSHATAAKARGVRLALVVLNRPLPSATPPSPLNRPILEARLGGVPVVEVGVGGPNAAELERLLAALGV